MIKCERGRTTPQKMKTRQQQTYCDMFNVYVFYIARSVFMGKNYSDNLHSIKNTEDLTMEQMFDISEKLIFEQSDVQTLNWENSSWKYWSLIGDEQIISLQRIRLFGFCIVSWKDEREPSIKHGMGRKVDVVQNISGIQKLGHNWWWANGIRVEYFTRIHHVAAQPQGPRVHVQNEQTARRIHRTDHLHVDVQRHLTEI